MNKEYLRVFMDKNYFCVYSENISEPRCLQTKDRLVATCIEGGINK